MSKVFSLKLSTPQDGTTPCQGGFTKGCGTVEIDLLLFTILQIRTYILQVTTVLCSIDITAFFDTIRLHPLVFQLHSEGINLFLSSASFFSSIIMSTPPCVLALFSSFFHTWPGLRQGGRFSVCGSKAFLRRIMSLFRPLTRPVYWGGDIELKDLEWADDVTLLVDSVEQAEHESKRFSQILTDHAVGYNDKTLFRTFGRCGAKTIRFGSLACRHLKNILNFSGSSIQLISFPIPTLSLA